MKDIDKELMQAAERGDLDQVKAILSNSKRSALSKDKAGITALMRAAANGHDHCVQLLISVSDASARDNKGRTVLMWGIQHARA